MLLFTHADQAQLAQSVVGTILDSACVGKGAEQKLASEAGVSAVFLSNIRHQRQMPSMQVAQQIAAFLPFSISEQNTWIHAVSDYWQARRAQLRQAHHMLVENPHGLLQELINMHFQGRYAVSPETTRKHLQNVISVAEPIIQSLSPAHLPLLFIELCGILFESYLSAGNLVYGLKLARYAQWIFEAYEHELMLYDRRDVAMQHIRTLYMEMIALSELRLYRQAQEVSFKMEQTPAFSLVRQHWMPVVYWDRIHAMAYIPRSSIAEANHLAREAHYVSDLSGDPVNDVAHMLISRSLCESYISHGNWRRAESILTSLNNQLPSLKHAGVLHKVLFFRTLARYFWSKPHQDLEQWQSAIDQARTLAMHAGLNTQMNQIYRDYQYENDSFYHLV